MSLCSSPFSLCAPIDAMSLRFFEVREHVFDGQHIREYPRATAHSQEDVLRLCAKQYIPRSNPKPQPGDVTIVAAHANGFVKVSRRCLPCRDARV